MNPLIFDIIIAAIVIIAALRGAIRGFVLSLCGVLSIFVAFIGAGFLSGLLAEPAAALLTPVVEQAVLSLLDKAVPSDLPSWEIPLTAVLDTLHASPWFSGMADAFSSALESGAVELVGGAALSLAHYAALQLARIILFVLTFVAILIVWWVMSHALDLAFHLPGLNFLNRFGGMALGLGEGIALCFILCWLFRDSYITAEMINGSFLLPYFCGENPLTNLPFLNFLNS